jgi:serine phosphatase RsbU (regulator of sigma subunit)
VPAARAAEVGGDWYDAFLQPAGATVLVIGDVIGHDIAGTAAMGQIRSIVRTIGAEDGAAPGEILRRADQVMETLQTGTAATAVVARLEQTDSERAREVTRLRWSNAGHPPPMAINPDGTVLPMATVPADRLLGVTPGVSRRESEVLLGRDAVVLLLHRWVGGTPRPGPRRRPGTVAARARSPDRAGPRPNLRPTPRTDAPRQP